MYKSLPNLVDFPCPEYTMKRESPRRIAKTTRRNAGLETGFRLFGGAMKLKLIFVLMELTILLIYPFAFLAGKLRQILKFKR